MKYYSWIDVILFGIALKNIVCDAQHVRGNIGKSLNFTYTFSKDPEETNHDNTKFNNLIKIIKKKNKQEKTQQLNSISKPFPPRADGVVNYGFNVFHGTTPEEQRRDLVGDRPQLFKLKPARPWSGSLSNDDYKLYYQFNDFSSHQYCSIEQDSYSYTYAAGSAMLNAQAETNFDVDLIFKDDIGSKLLQTFGGNLMKLRTLKGALAYGQASASLNAFESLNAGYQFSSQHSITQSLYSLELDYESIKSRDWTEDLVKSCQDLGDSPSTAQILSFFDNFGTHGIEKAKYGMKVSSSLFMQGDLQANAYQSLLSHSDIRAYLSGNMDIDASTQFEAETGSELNGVSFRLVGREVDGGLKSSETSPYCGLLDVLDLSSDPSLISWTYRPIWTMPIPSLSYGAKIVMKQVADDIVDASEECMMESCSGYGLCAPKKNSWFNSGISVESLVEDLDFFWDSEQCFCFDGSYGEDCSCLPDGTLCIEEVTCRGCCNTATRWNSKGGQWACGEDESLTEPELLRLIQERCVIRMWQWDNHQSGTPRYQEWSLSGSWEYLQFQGGVDDNDTMGFEINCDSTCSGCTNGSALKTAIEALRDICVKFGWSDNGKDYPERNVNHCAYTSGRSTFNLDGDVDGNDSWFFETYIASSSSGGNSPMHNYLRSKTRLGAHHSDNNGAQVHNGFVGFDHSYCSAGPGSSCQVSPVRLKVNMMGGVDSNDRIGLMWYVA